MIEESERACEGLPKHFSLWNCGKGGEACQEIWEGGARILGGNPGSVVALIARARMFKRGMSVYFCQMLLTSNSMWTRVFSNLVAGSSIILGRMVAVELWCYRLGQYVLKSESKMKRRHSVWTMLLIFGGGE